MSDRLRHAAIVGGGVAAALAALALARRIPGLSVTWIDTGVAGDAIEDLLGAARPSLGHLHRAIGIDDTELLRRIHAGPRLGTLVEQWGTEPFFRGHDRLPPGLHGVPLHLLWLRLGEAPDRPDWIHIAGRAMAGTKAAGDRPLPALLLDLDEYRAVLGRLAGPAGIRHVMARAVDIELQADKSAIAKLHLPDGETIAADLYVDATGPARRLHDRLSGGWISWADRLPTRTLRLEHRPPVIRPRPFDRLLGGARGWTIEAYLPRATLRLSGWGAGPAPDQDLEGEAIALRPGRLAAPFCGNVVALGSAAAALEPIGATALHLLCRQIERLIACWPGRDLNPVELALYNRRSALDADRMRDFAQLHFAASARDTPFWRGADASMSPQLSDDIALFEARGRILPADEDGFEPDEWIATLVGLGFRPGQRDALAQAMPIGLVRQWVGAAARPDPHRSTKGDFR